METGQEVLGRKPKSLPFFRIQKCLWYCFVWRTEILEIVVGSSFWSGFVCMFVFVLCVYIHTHIQFVLSYIFPETLSQFSWYRHCKGGPCELTLTNLSPMPQPRLFPMSYKKKSLNWHLDGTNFFGMALTAQQLCFLLISQVLTKNL